MRPVSDSQIPGQIVRRLWGNASGSGLETDSSETDNIMMDEFVSRKIARTCSSRRTRLGFELANFSSAVLALGTFRSGAFAQGRRGDMQDVHMDRLR